MLFRIIIRNVPSTFQILKAATTQSSKQLRIITSYQTPSTLTHNVLSFRAYSEQVKPEMITVDYEQVKKATQDKNIIIVDVREPDEIKEHGKIPNSINIPLGNITTVLSMMPENEFQKTYQRPKPTENSEMIFYCMIGKRSGMAQQNAFNLGYKNVKNYLGSYTDWAAKQ